MSISHALLTAFLVILAWHLGLSMELPLVAWLGTGLALLAASKVVTVERPTWGLLFVLFAGGALAGNQVLEEWAVDGSWPRDNGLGAGIMISLLLYLLWVFAARGRSDTTLAIDRDSQTVLVWGLLCLLFISPPAAGLITLLGEPAALLTLIGILLACLAMLADRCLGLLRRRLLLLLPVLFIVPPLQYGLDAGQGPVISALGNLVPRSSNSTRTGFSPYQTLRASVFLRPSTRAVMRIETDAPPSPYLAGNRLVTLNEELVWLPSQQPLQSYSTLNAELLPSNEWRFEIDNHHFGTTGAPGGAMTVHSLSGDDYLFVTPGTTHISGRFTALSRNAAEVWTPIFDRGADPRWRLESTAPAIPDAPGEEVLQLPAFWDDELQTHSESFAGDDDQATADNIVTYFLGRPYSLRTDFDPQQPFHDFFLNDRAGYCFWFASATTLALRANGIPSRLVGGYVMHEQLNDELWLVRQRDAHSWVEWQDQQGYWHTIDPTPPSIEAFFGGYESSRFSHWYHTLAAQWQRLLDRILANELTANLVRWGGLAILAFLFAREYRRIRRRRAALDARAIRWQKLWQRFLQTSRLPAQASWTTGTYAENLPATWPEPALRAARTFLQRYDLLRFSPDGEAAIEEAEQSLARCQYALKH